MMITVATEIKYVEPNFEVPNSIEVNLQQILVEDFKQGLPNDLSNVL